MARRFANEGAYVFIMHPGDPEFARAIQGTGKKVTWLQGDVFSPDDLRQLFEQIREKRGKIDILVVTISAPDEYVPFSEITQEHYEAVFGHPVKGVLLSGSIFPFAFDSLLASISEKFCCRTVKAAACKLPRSRNRHIQYDRRTIGKQRECLFSRKPDRSPFVKDQAADLEAL